MTGPNIRANEAVTLDRAREIMAANMTGTVPDALLWQAREVMAADMVRPR